MKLAALVAVVFASGIALARRLARGLSDSAHDLARAALGAMEP